MWVYASAERCWSRSATFSASIASSTSMGSFLFSFTGRRAIRNAAIRARHARTGLESPQSGNVRTDPGPNGRTIHGRRVVDPRREADPVPQRGVRQGEGARDRAPGAHQDGEAPAVQEAPAGPPQGDQGAGEGPRAAHQGTRRQGGADAGPRARPGRGGRGGDGGDRRGDEGAVGGEGSRARAPRHRRGGEAAQEREDRAVERVRGDRQLPRDRDARRVAPRRRDGEARARVPPAGGAHGGLPAEADPAAHEGGRHRGGPRGRAAQAGGGVILVFAVARHTRGVVVAVDVALVIAVERVVAPAVAVHPRILLVVVRRGATLSGRQWSS